MDEKLEVIITLIVLIVALIFALVKLYKNGGPAVKTFVMYCIIAFIVVLALYFFKDIQEFAFKLLVWVLNLAGLEASV